MINPKTFYSVCGLLINHIMYFYRNNCDLRNLVFYFDRLYYALMPNLTIQTVHEFMDTLSSYKIHFTAGPVGPKQCWESYLGNFNYNI